MNILVPEASGDAGRSFAEMFRVTGREAKLISLDSKSVHHNSHLFDKHETLPIVKNRQEIDKGCVRGIIDILMSTGQDTLIAPSSEHLTLQLIEAIDSLGLPKEMFLGVYSIDPIHVSYDKLRLGQQEGKCWQPCRLTYADGYVIAKPRFGVGSRGVLKVGNSLGLEDYVYQEELFGTEYVADYSFGQVVVREVYAQRGGADTEMKVVYNQEVIDLVQSIASRFYGQVFNVQMKRDKHGALKVFDLGVRLSGASACSLKAGVNLVERMFDKVGHVEYKDTSTIYRELRFL